MSLARFNGSVIDANGKAVPNANIEVRRSTGNRGLVVVYSDREGLVPRGNPFQSDSRGRFYFHVLGGSYRVRAYTGDSLAPTFETFWDFTPVGNTQELDADQLGQYLSAGIAPFATKAALDATTPTSGYTGAVVLNDPDPTKNGWYTYASGAWVRRRGLPDTVAQFIITGGDANNIIAGVSPGIDPGVVKMFYITPQFSNTGPMTINAKPLKNALGVDLVSGEYPANRISLVVDEGSQYRLLSDPDIAGVAAQVLTAAAQVDQTAEQFGDLSSAMTSINASVASTQTNSAAALSARDQAILAQNASFALGPKYADEATGRAAVTDGQTFLVVGSGGTAAVEYRRISSTQSVVVARYPSVAAVQDLSSTAVLRLQQPNLVPDRVNKQAEVTIANSTQVGFGPSTNLPYPSSYNGRPCWRFDTTGSTGPNVEIIAPASLFGDEIVASLLVHAQTATGAGATGSSNRVLLRQFSGASIGTRSEITAVRQPPSGGFLASPSTAASPNEQRIEFRGIPKDPAATFIGILIENTNTGGATPRSIWFSEILIGSGRDSAFRLKPPANVQYPNLLPNDAWAFNSSLQGGIASVTRESGFDVLNYLKASQAGATNAFRSYTLPATGLLAPGKSVQAIYEYMTDTTISNSVRLDLLFLDANGAEITSERALGPANPAAAVTTWTAQRVTKAVIPVCATIQFRFTWFAIPTATGTYAKFRRPAVINSLGDEISLDDIFMIATGVTSSSGTIVCMDPTNGNDAGNGTISAPVKTFDRMLDLNGGVGTVLMPAGVQDMAANNQLDLSRVKNLTIVGGLGAQPGFARTVLRYGLKLTGITKTAGQTKVYQATAALGTDIPNFLWLEGVPDSRTAVTPRRAHYATRGRSHRLMQSRIERTGTWNTQSATKAVALAEIDASSDPRFWYSISEGVVYFSIPGGGDATSSNVYASLNNILTKNRPSVFGTYGNGGKLTLIDVDARYVNYSFIGLTRLEAYNCYVHGAAFNCWDVTGKALLVGCEASGAGSAATPNGDGFNCHDEGDWEHKWCWSHDNRDDGWSSHENSREFGLAPVAENNSGSGLTPAYGAQAIYINPMTIENALNTVRLRTGKLGGIESHQNPNAPFDNGLFTSVEVYGGVSIGDQNGFIDGKTNSGGTVEAYMKAFDCKAIDPVQFGIACQTYGNCRYIGTDPAKAKHPNAGQLNVYNGDLVT